MFYPILRMISRGLSWVAIILRATGAILAIAIAFVFLAPVQWVLVRLKSPRAAVLPRIFYRTILWLVKVRVEVGGKIPAEIPALVVANHVSWTDIFALGALFPASFVAKSEVSRWPIIRTFAYLVNTIFVDRGARTTIPATNAAMVAQIEAGEHVVLFPEGTTRGGDPQPFRSSHFAVIEALHKRGRGYAIQPIAIRYSAPHAAWIGDDALLPHIFNLMKNPPVTCQLIFCEPLALDAPLPRRTAAQECFQRIAAAYRAACSDYPAP